MGASNSSISSSSNNKRKTGRVWSYQIYFDPEADQEIGKDYYIEDEGLISKLSTLVDVEENIINVYAYKEPLSDWQLTSFIIYHLFIIFKTKSWWWSIEKYADGITIQRSKFESAVRCKHRRDNRKKPIALVKSDSGRKSVKDLIFWLYSENELNKAYDYLSRNCKTFAKRVYDHVAANTNLFWFDGAFS